MFDGYIVKSTATIDIPCGCRKKLKKGSICYFVTRDKKSEQVCVEFPDNYGGSLGFFVTDKQFDNFFESVGKKIYPKSNEIWDGTAWVKNPMLNEI